MRPHTLDLQRATQLLHSLRQSWHVCSLDKEKHVHDLILSLRCTPSMAEAAKREEKYLGDHERTMPQSKNYRLSYRPLYVDVMQVYRYADKSSLLFHMA
jgi:hypothetical protein